MAGFPARFTAINLARLPLRPRSALTFEAYRAAYMADLAARLNAADVPYDVGDLETDTYAITGQAFAYRTERVAVSIDDAVAAVLLPWSWGAYLDGLGASQDPPVQRLALVEPPRAYVYGTESVADWEDDESFRARIQLAPEALSTCGPEGAYLWFALAVEGALAASVYGPMSFGGYGPLRPDGTRVAPFVPLGEVHIPILSTSNDGTTNGVDNGSASPALVAAVQKAVSADERRPIADLVTVSAATVLPFTLDVALEVGSGADPGAVILQAYDRVRATCDLQHRPGGAVKAKGLYAAAYVPDANGRPIVGDVDLGAFVDVNAAPITSAAPGPAYVAPFCPGPTDGELVDGRPVIASDGAGTLTLTAGGISITLEVVDD